MSRPPITSTTSLFTPVDLGAIAAELLASARAAADGKAARTLLKTGEVTMLVIALRRGTRMVEHSAPSSTVVLSQLGRVVFTSSEESVAVTGAHALLMGPGVRHDVHAEEDSVFTLILRGSPPASG
jgi:quercetin dioxygenase-like cupin family protein